MLSDLNAWAEKYQYALVLLVPMALGVVGFLITPFRFWFFNLFKKEKELQTHNIARDERIIFRDVYNKIVSAIDSVWINGRVSSEARYLFWSAKDIARLELPDDIKRYTDDLFDKANEAWGLKAQMNDPDTNEMILLPLEEKQRLIKEHAAIIKYFIHLNQEPHKVFSKYMKIKT